MIHFTDGRWDIMILNNVALDQLVTVLRSVIHIVDETTIMGFIQSWDNLGPENDSLSVCKDFITFSATGKEGCDICIRIKVNIYGPLWMNPINHTLVNLEDNMCCTAEEVFILIVKLT